MCRPVESFRGLLDGVAKIWAAVQEEPTKGFCCAPKALRFRSLSPPCAGLFDLAYFLFGVISMYASLSGGLRLVPSGTSRDARRLKALRRGSFYLLAGEGFTSRCQNPVLVYSGDPVFA